MFRFHSVFCNVFHLGQNPNLVYEYSTSHLLFSSDGERWRLKHPYCPSILDQVLHHRKVIWYKMEPLTVFPWSREIVYKVEAWLLCVCGILSAFPVCHVGTPSQKWLYPFGVWLNCYVVGWNVRSLDSFSGVRHFSSWHVAPYSCRSGCLAGLRVFLWPWSCWASWAVLYSGSLDWCTSVD